MSLKSHRVRTTAIGGLAMVAVFGAAAAPAGAVQTTLLRYQCKYPLIGIKNLDIKIDLDIPDTWQASVPTAPFGVNATASAYDMAAGLKSVKGLVAIKGVSTAYATVKTAQGFDVPAVTDAVIDKTVLPNPVPDPLVLPAKGETPPLTFDDPGVEKIFLDDLAINLTALDAADQPIVLPPVTKTIDGKTVADSDGDKNTFDVYCLLRTDVGTQNLQIGQFEILDTLTPTPVIGTPTPTSSPTPTPVVSTPTPTPTPVVSTPTPTPVVDPVTPIPTPIVSTTTPTPSPTPDKPTPTVVVPTTTPTPPVTTPTPGGQTANLSYTLQGSTAIQTLTKGSLPLTGSIDAQLDLATGNYTATTVINDTQGRLTALGFLPVTVGIGFVPSGPTTGKLADDQLTADLKIRIKVKSVKAFGVVPLAGGNSCQTKSLSSISLKSIGFFDPTTYGGGLGGTYAISDLNGCGVLNGLVSPLTAGKGNSIVVQVTPKK